MPLPDLEPRRRETWWERYEFWVVVPAIILFVAVLAVLAPRPARCQPVDLALVLAVDVSGSIDGEEYELQKEGYAAAVSDPRVIEAISRGVRGAIVVTYVEWAGQGEQRQQVPWTRIAGQGDAAAFGAAVRAASRSFSSWTSLSDAIDFSVRLLLAAPPADRLVIDISGDGINNNGRPVTDARDGAVAAGIVINGLAVLNEDAGIEAYFRDNVVGGPGHFVIPVSDFPDLRNALVAKLVTEIAVASPLSRMHAALDRFEARTAALLERMERRADTVLATQDRIAEAHR